jgi:hypothetical protein
MMIAKNVVVNVRTSRLAKKKVVTAVKKSVAVNSFTYAKWLIFSQLQN